MFLSKVPYCFILLVVCSDLVEYTTLPKVMRFGSFASTLFISVSSKSEAGKLWTRRQITPLCFLVTCISVLRLKQASGWISLPLTCKSHLRVQPFPDDTAWSSTWLQSLNDISNWISGYNFCYSLLMIGYFEMVFAMSEQESPVFSLGLIRMGYF